MYILYHHPLCPLSRQVRILFKEYNIDFTAIREDYWLRRTDFLKKNPAGTVPVLEAKNNLVIIGNYSIIEYINDTNDNFHLMPKEDLIIRAEIRNNVSWFNEKFFREVSKILLDEKMVRLLMRIGSPRSNFIRAAKSNLQQHLTLLNAKLKQHSCMVSDKISCADIVAAAHISVLDYFGEIHWDSWEMIKQWYSIVKSRPSFQPILSDRIAGFPPPKHYSELDL
ncbi:MAG: glutathione S-transferase family protein [Rickettsiaceae bacterium]